MPNTSNRKRMSRRAWWLVAVALALLLLAGAVALPSLLGRTTPGAQAQTGDVVAAVTGDLSASATASGQVSAVRSASLAARNAGLVEAVLVSAGQRVDADDVLVQLNPDNARLQVDRAQQNVILQEAELAALLQGVSAAELRAAEAAVAGARAELDELLAGPDAFAIAESEANIRRQQAAVAAASAAYGSTRDSIAASSLAAAEADLVEAEIAYDQAKERNDDFAISFTHEALVEAQEELAIAQAKVGELTAGPKAGNVTSASANVAAAAANLEQTQADHAALLAGPTEEQIATARASLAQAEANLAGLLHSATAEDIRVAEAELEQARLSLADAQEALDNMAITAPFAGLVTAVHVAQGEWAAGVVADLVGSELEVILQVDEIDIGALAPGQEAIVTLESWPGEAIGGQIASIAPSAVTNGDGIVTYDVHIRLAETPLPVLVGMTANAELITANRENVLLVPNAAVTADRQAGTYWVQKLTREMVDGAPQTERVEVKIGLKDEDFTQIISGLAEGDEVLVGRLEAPTLQFGPGFGGRNNEE